MLYVMSFTSLFVVNQLQHTHLLHTQLIPLLMQINIRSFEMIIIQALSVFTCTPISEHSSQISARTWSVRFSNLILEKLWALTGVSGWVSLQYYISSWSQFGIYLLLRGIVKILYLNKLCWTLTLPLMECGSRFIIIWWHHVIRTMFTRHTTHLRGLTLCK